MTTCRRPAWRGQTLMAFALAMSLMMFGMFTMVVDVSVLYSQAAEVQSAAQDAAISGANTVSACALYTSGIPKLSVPGGCDVNAPDFRERCRKSGNDGARITSVAINNQTKCFAKDATGVECDVATGTQTCLTVVAKVTKAVKLPMPLFGITATVSSSFEAEPRAGTTRVDCAITSSCPNPPP